MAVFRKIRIAFWQDRYVLALTPEEKYFFLYLLSNSHTKQCGIYEISIEIMKLETGLDEKKVFEHIGKFKKDGKIKFNKKNSEIMILNWLKNNPANSPKIAACIRDEIVNVKTKAFVELLYRLCIKYQYNIDTISQEEEGEEGEEEKENSCQPIKSLKNTKSDKVLKDSKNSKDNPLIKVAELCYKENGEDCRLKQNSKKLEEKCVVCMSEREKWKLVNLKNK